MMKADVARSIERIANAYAIGHHQDAGRSLHHREYRRRTIKPERPQIHLDHRSALCVHGQRIDIDVEAGFVDISNGVVELAQRCGQSILGIFLACDL